MNRAELISEIAELTGQPKTEIGEIVTGVFHYITASLSKGEKVTLVGFGTFERRSRSARTGRNPQTLAPLRIPASKVPAFRAGQELKEVVNGHARQSAWTGEGSNRATSSTSRKPAKKSGKAKKR